MDSTEKQKMNRETSRKSLLWKTMLPVLIGAAVAWWLFRDEFSADVWQSIRWDRSVAFGLVLAILAGIGRDFGMTWRFRELTDRKLTWGNATNVCMLWEFTSAVTPSAVGGSALGMFFLNSYGISMGCATTLILTTLILDEGFFVAAVPLAMLICDPGELFGFAGSDHAFFTSLKGVFWLVYAGIAAYTLLLVLGVLVKPHLIRRFLMWLFGMRWLRRWSGGVDRLTSNMVEASHSLRSNNAMWWIRVSAATCVSWISRFLMVNALFFAFAPYASQLVVFCRQVVVWVILMVSPTPGGSGVSEWLFTEYYGDMLHIAGLAVLIALFWRVLSYYVYLLIGAGVLPAWIRRKVRKRAAESNDKQ